MTSNGSQRSEALQHSGSNMSRHQRFAKKARGRRARSGADGAVRSNVIQAEPAGRPRAVFVDAERSDAIPDEEIALVAYGLWLARGRPEGTDREDWSEAERRLREERFRKTSATHALVAEQAREAIESRQACEAPPSNRERMVDIGRGNQQAGRQGS